MLAAVGSFVIGDHFLDNHNYIRHYWYRIVLTRSLCDLAWYSITLHSRQAMIQPISLLGRRRSI